MLDADTERELVENWRRKGDKQALERLIAAYRPLNLAYARKFRRFNVSFDDLVQEGDLGLMTAIGRFDLDRQVRFGTYARWWVRAAMQEFVLRNWSVVRAGVTAPQKALFFGLRAAQGRTAARRPELDATERRQAIAKAMGVAIGEVERAERRFAAPDERLDEPVNAEGDRSRIETIADERPSPEDIVMSLRDAGTRSRWLAQALSDLPARERRILDQRWLGAGGAVPTFEELGRELGLSKERVRQLEARAMRRVRDSLLARGDRASLVPEAGPVT